MEIWRNRWSICNKWKVLGADDETGELLIVAADVLKNTDNSTKKLVLKGITGYLNGVEELNKVCQVYGKGKGATGARSINYEKGKMLVIKQKIFQIPLEHNKTLWYSIKN